MAVETKEDIQAQLDSYINELADFEAQLMPQLDHLAEIMPEIYAGYADMVRTIVGSAMQILKPSQKTANRLNFAVELGARSIQAFGAFKSAVEHNRLLKKYMAVKTAYAEGNLEKVSMLLPKIKRLCNQTSKIFDKCSGIEYQIHELNEDKIKRVQNLQVKAFSIYRTNMYMYELCDYLNSEYSAWLEGKQKSRKDIPDYYVINELLSERLFGKDLLDAYSNAAECTSSIFGKQIVLLSDYQLTFMALGQNLCKVNVQNAHPLVGSLISDCGAHEKYIEITQPFVKHIEDKSPEGIIIFMGLYNTPHFQTGGARF